MAAPDDPPTCAPSGTGSKLRISRSHAATSSVVQSTMPTSRECEHMKLASLGGAQLEVADRAGKATRGAAVARIDVVEGDGSGPATHARQHGDVLLAVRSPVGDRLTDDS